MSNYGKNLIMRKINKVIEDNIKKILSFFIIVQPILDSLTALSVNYLNLNLTIGSIVRLLFLLFCIYYIIVLDNTSNKKRNILFLIFFFVYLILFSITVVAYKDFNALLYELKNTINTFYLLIVLIAFLDIFKQYGIRFKLKNIIITYFIYIALIIIPNLTHTGFLSYSHSKVGNVGWFLSANGVGNILSILLPFLIFYIIKSKKRIFLKLIMILLTIYVFVSMGTKVPVLSLIICFVINMIYYVVDWFRLKKYKNIVISGVISVVALLSALVILPKTSFYKNIEIHKNYLGFNSYFEVFTRYDLIDHFIFSQRLTFLSNTNKSYQKAHLPEKILGIGYIENYGTDDLSLKTIEIDYLEIFYRNGIVGVVFYLYVLYFYVLKEKRLKEKNLINAQYKISVLLILLLSLFSGHVLVAPAVSIFVALIITIMLRGGLYEKIDER